MASDKNKNQDRNVVENLNTHLTSVGEKVANNKKIIFIGIGIVAVVAAFVLSYLFIFKNPRTNNSWKAYDFVYMQQQKQMLAGDTAVAKAYEKVANQFSSTDAGNIAKLSAAQAFYDAKNYDAAIKYLNKFDISEPQLKIAAKILLGDCYVNKKNYKEALSAYDNALGMADNNTEIAPYILFKEATIYDAQKKYGQAIECYEKIKNEYPDYVSPGQLSMDYYIEREKALSGK